MLMKVKRCSLGPQHPPKHTAPGLTTRQADPRPAASLSAEKQSAKKAPRLLSALDTRVPHEDGHLQQQWLQVFLPAIPSGARLHAAAG